MEWKDELIASFYEKHREPKDSIVKFKEYCKSTFHALMFLNFVYNLKWVYTEISVYVIFSYHQGSTNPHSYIAS